MPILIHDKEDLKKFGESLEGKLPVLVEIWTVNDLQLSHLDEDDIPVLSENQAIELLYALQHNYDASIGINWDWINAQADSLFPICNGCNKLMKECECKDE